MFKRNIFILCILISSMLKAENINKVSVQLLWKHQFEFAGFYMAKEKGFYDDVGIDASFKEYEFGINISEDVVNQKSNFGVSRTSLIRDKINGLDIYMLMPLLQTTPLVIMTKKREDIKDVSDLMNKKIMLADNEFDIASLNAMFKVNGLTKNNYIYVKHTFDVESLITDKIDAMSVYLSNEPYYLQKRNIKYNIFSPCDYGFTFYDDILFTSKQFANSNPKLVKDFYEATKKGWEYAFSNIEETANLIYKQYKIENKTIEHLIYEGTELSKLAKFNLKEYGKFNPDIINQIIQTYNLLDFSKSDVDYNEFIYPDAIYKEKDINIIFLLKISGVVLILMLGLYYWNRKLSKLNKKIIQSNEKTLLLLDNVSQGFLTFKSNFIVDDEYSKECEKLLGKEIALKDIRTLMFNDEDKKIFFSETLIFALNEPIEIRRNSYLSLLPELIFLNKRILKLEYKIVNNSTFMLILTNVTTQKKLENKIKKEQEIFRMIVSIVSESSLFYELIKEYEEFIHSNIHTFNIDALYRQVHTFKGTFSQFYINDIVKSLHSFENLIAKMLKDKKYSKTDSLADIIKNYDFKTSYYETKKLISEILGDDFFENQKYIKIDILNILDLQHKISDMIENNQLLSSECKELLKRIENLSKQNLYYMLKPYSFLVKKLAIELSKEVNEVIIDGDKEYLVQSNFKPFIKSLVHVFRNCVDHGIESSEERINKNKNEIATITCQFKEINNIVYIIISDDGAGLDIEKIRELAINIGIDISEYKEEEILKLIFNNNFTTKNTISCISGRGIGLDAVKFELDKLNGEINIISSKDIGTIFEFKIPLLIKKGKK